MNSNNDSGAARTFAQILTEDYGTAPSAVDAGVGWPFGRPTDLGADQLTGKDAVEAVREDVAVIADAYPNYVELTAAAGLLVATVAELIDVHPQAFVSNTRDDNWRRVFTAAGDTLHGALSYECGVNVPLKVGGFIHVPVSFDIEDGLTVGPGSFEILDPADVNLLADVTLDAHLSDAAEAIVRQSQNVYAVTQTTAAFADYKKVIARNADKVARVPHGPVNAYRWVERSDGALICMLTFGGELPDAGGIIPAPTQDEELTAGLIAYDQQQFVHRIQEAFGGDEETIKWGIHTEPTTVPDGKGGTGYIITIRMPYATASAGNRAALSELVRDFSRTLIDNGIFVRADQYERAFNLFTSAH